MSAEQHEAQLRELYGDTISLTEAARLLAAKDMIIESHELTLDLVRDMRNTTLSIVN